MPTLQQQAALMTRDAWVQMVRTAPFVPEDKWDWVPMGAARSLQDILAECALLPGSWHASLLGSEGSPLRYPQEYARAKAELDTLEKIRAVGDPGIEHLCQLIEAVPDSDLDQSREMPWGGTMTLADRIFICYWNLVYHYGQVNYLQMMLGDTAMH